MSVRCGLGVLVSSRRCWCLVDLFRAMSMCRPRTIQTGQGWRRCGCENSCLNGNEISFLGLSPRRLRSGLRCVWCVVKPFKKLKGFGVAFESFGFLRTGFCKLSANLVHSLPFRCGCRLIPHPRINRSLLKFPCGLVALPMSTETGKVEAA